MMGTEIFKIDASWAEKLTKTRVQFLLTPTVFLKVYIILNAEKLPSSFQFSQYYKKGLEVVIMDGNMT